MTGVIADLERRRREAERRAAAAAAARRGPGRPPAPPPAPRRVDHDDGGPGERWTGRWAGAWSTTSAAPRQSNGTTIRYNGIGIGAAAGSPVRAVESGTVEMAAPFEGYGPTVVVSHGGGYYSLYLYLKDVHVRPGAQVTKGQIIGTVGGEATPEGAHVEFQIREPGGARRGPGRVAAAAADNGST